MKRREILKTLTMLPLAGAIGNFGSLVQAAQTAPLSKRDLFKEFGLCTFISTSGCFTSLSGSLMQPDAAADAIRETAKSFCRLEEVQYKVGEGLPFRYMPGRSWSLSLPVHFMP